MSVFRIPGPFYGHLSRANSPLTGENITMILEKPDGSVAAIEVKASVTIAASDFAALQTLRDELGKQFRAGVALYLGDQIVPFGDKLWLVPVPALWAP
jgi:hypothetical protein